MSTRQRLVDTEPARRRRSGDEDGCIPPRTQATGTGKLCLCLGDARDTWSRSPLTPDDGVGGEAETDATSGVTALYRAHAVGLIRLAVVMLRDRAAAEDVV